MYNPGIMPFRTLFSALLVACVLPGAEPQPVQLPAPAGAGTSLHAALSARRSEREFSPRRLPVATLSNLLWAAYGVNRPVTGGRTAPSAHNWQAVDVYVALEDGLWLYDAVSHRLLPVASTDARGIAGTQDFTATAPLNLVYVARMSKMKASAEDTQADLVAWAAIEAGAISQNVSLFCAAEGLATVVRAGVQRAAFTKTAKLPPDARILLAQTVGFRK